MDSFSQLAHMWLYLPQGVVSLQTSLSLLQVGPIPIIRVSRDLAQYESKTTSFFSVAIFRVCNIFIFLYSYFYPEYLCFRYGASSRLLLQKKFFRTDKLVSVATSIFTSRRLDLVSEAIVGFSKRQLSSLVKPSRLHGAHQALIRDLILLTT